MKPFGQFFKELRQSRQMSAYRIAKRIGVHPSFISNIEAGRRPMSRHAAQRIAEDVPELGVTVAKLLGWQVAAKYGPEVIQHAMMVLGEELRV